MIAFHHIIQYLFSALPFTSPPPTPSPSPRVLVIGAGFGGVSVLKGLVDVPPNLRKDWVIDVFESRHDIGGLWLPDTNFTSLEKLPETPLYPDLISNDPAPAMTFFKRPYPKGTLLQPHHWVHWQYEKDMVDDFGLSPYILFNHKVVNMEWNKRASVWEVDYLITNPQPDTLHHKTYNHVVITTGKEQFPHIPEMPGVNDWLAAGRGHREIFHSKYYRTPDSAIRRQVFVVGSGPSGKHICEAMGKVAKETHCIATARDNNPDGFVFPGTIRKTTRAIEFTNNSILLEDNTSIATDDNALVYLATGWDMRFPFLKGLDIVQHHSDPDLLNSTRSLSISQEYIRPLLNDTWAIQDAFPLNALAIPIQELVINQRQRNYPVGLLLGHSIVNPSIMPSKEEARVALLEDETIKKENGIDPYKTHRIFPVTRAFQTLDDIMDLLKEKSAVPLPEWVMNFKFNEPWTMWDLCHLFDFDWAWRHANEVSPEFAASFTTGVETEEQWVKAMEKMIDFQSDWYKSRGIKYPSGVCGY